MEIHGYIMGQLEVGLHLDSIHSEEGHNANSDGFQTCLDHYHLGLKNGDQCELHLGVDLEMG